MKIIRKLVFATIITMFLFYCVVQTAESADQNIVTSQYCYVKANKNANIYAEDKKTILFTVAKDDFFTATNINSDSKWTELIQSQGSNVFILTKNLAHTNDGRLAVKENFIIYPLMIANTVDAKKSCFIYTEPDRKSPKIGIMRRRLVYEVYVGKTEYDDIDDADDRLFSYQGFTPISTFNGYGWVLTDRAEVGIEES